jgi:hypothetical protein
MFLTLKYLIHDEPDFITFDGTPKECQDQANAFIGDGIYINRIIVMGEK